MSTSMKCDNILFLWRNFFLNIANKRDYVNNCCSRPLNSFDRHCHEWYIYNSGNNFDELPDVGFYW